jgi:hypothetical protein
MRSSNGKLEKTRSYILRFNDSRKCIEPITAYLIKQAKMHISNRTHTKYTKLKIAADGTWGLSSVTAPQQYGQKIFTIIIQGAVLKALQLYEMVQTVITYDLQSCCQ